MVVVVLIKTDKMVIIVIEQAIVRRGGWYRSPIVRHPILTLDRVPPGRYIITSIIASSHFDVWGKMFDKQRNQRTNEPTDRLTN